MQIELWQLKPGDELDYHVAWARELRGGERIASQLWTVEEPANALQIHAQGVNMVPMRLHGDGYPINTVASIWLSVSAGFLVGQVVRLTNTIITSATQPRTITAHRYVEIVSLYAHEQADPPPVRSLASLGSVAV